MKNVRRIEFWFACALIGLLLYFLWFHWQLGLHRYFDADEFAHLHWAAQMAAGQKPYIDFFLFFPPGFYVMLVPLFWLGSGITPIVAGRILEFMIFTGVVGVSIVLFWYVRRSWIAIIVGVILAFLPLPFDKFIEIRPDTLATLFVLVGLLFQIRWMHSHRDRPSHARVDPLRSSGLWAGLCYSFSLLVLPKTLPQVVFSCVIATIVCWQNKRQKIRPFIVGLVTPLLITGVWLLTLGNISQVWYSLTKLPFEANQISKYFIMMPDLFFYPNEIFYGRGGYTFPLLVNHGIWIIGLLVGLYRLLTPTFPKGKDRAWEELLIAGSFMVNVIFYVVIVPLKHAQYLIPIAVFVAWYVADGAFMMWEKMRNTNMIATAIIFVVVILGGGGLVGAFVQVNRPKLLWTNAKDLKDLDVLFATIAKTEYILDLDGRTMYYPSPYPVCCLPFGQFAPFLSRKLPSLSQSLEQTKTKYISEGTLKRTTTLLPQDQAYIRDHYQPSGDIDGLLVRK